MATGRAACQKQARHKNRVTGKLGEEMREDEVTTIAKKFLHLVRRNVDYFGKFGLYARRAVLQTGADFTHSLNKYWSHGSFSLDSGDRLG